jgi:hypothetical protein
MDERIQVRHNSIPFHRLPRAFDRFTLLHISDLHVDMSEGAMRGLEQLLPDLEYEPRLSDRLMRRVKAAPE